MGFGYLESSDMSLDAERRLARREDGSVAVEFALVILPMLGLIFAILETGLAFLFGLSVDNATQELARLIQTGQAQQAGVTSLESLKSKFVCPSSGNGLFPTFVDCSRLIVDVRTATSFSSADTSANFYAGQVSTVRERPIRLSLCAWHTGCPYSCRCWSRVTSFSVPARRAWLTTSPA